MFQGSVFCCVMGACSLHFHPPGWAPPGGLGPCVLQVFTALPPASGAASVDRTGRAWRTAPGRHFLDRLFSLVDNRIDNLYLCEFCGAPGSQRRDYAHVVI